MNSINNKKSNNKHCKTWWLIDWIKQTKHTDANDSGFGDQAQNALDDVESGAVPHSKGTMYRSGVTLAELKPGECGTVRRLLGSTQGRLRLLELGLTAGTHIKVVRAAAFGGPVDILVRGYQLSLRRDEAASIWLDDEDETK